MSDEFFPEDVIDIPLIDKDDRIKSILEEEPDEEIIFNFPDGDKIEEIQDKFKEAYRTFIFEFSQADVIYQYERVEDNAYDDLVCPHQRREYLIEYTNDIGLQHSIRKILPYFARDYFFNEEKHTIEEIKKEINDAGGCFQYWRLHKNKCESLEKIRYGLYLNIMLLSMVSDLYDKAIDDICIYNEHSHGSHDLNSIILDPHDEEFMQKISWDTSTNKRKKEFLRHKRLLQRQEISFNQLSKYGKPYFKRAANEGAKAAASLFMYWHEKNYITGLMVEINGYPTVNVKIITDAFDMNENRKLTARGIKNAFAKIKNGDDGKLFIFRNLLNKK